MIEKSEQINVRISIEQKKTLDEYAELKGHSDRSAVIRELIDDLASSPEEMRKRAKQHRQIAKDLIKKALESEKMQQKKVILMQKQAEKASKMCGFCGQIKPLIPCSNENGEQKSSCIACLQTANERGFQRIRK